MKTHTCGFCNKDTSHKPSNRRKFCNLVCFTEHNRKFHTRRKRITRKCILCESGFETTEGNPKKYCSSKCAAIKNNKDREYSESAREKLKKAFKDGKLTGLTCGHLVARKKKQRRPPIAKVCAVCKEEYFIHKWQESSGAKKFCSKKCSYSSPLLGGYRPGSVTNYKSGWYDSPIAGHIWLDSSYEFVMAMYLDEKKYKWKKNYQAFPYINIKQEQHNYIPDFYIYDLDLWVETKGYFTENDKCKLRDFPHKIKLIGKKIIHNPNNFGF